MRKLALIPVIVICVVISPIILVMLALALTLIGLITGITQSVITLVESKRK